MDPEELYSRLEKIKKLEKIIFEKAEKKKLEIGDKHVIEYNRLVEPILILSLEDLKEYHEFSENETDDLLKERLYKQKKELEKKFDEQIEGLEEKLYKQRNKLKKQSDTLKKEILDALKDICSPKGYSAIESAIEKVYFDYI